LSSVAHLRYRDFQQFVGRTILLMIARYAHLIPRRGVYPLARALGSLIMAISPRHRRIVMANLRSAFGREKSEAALRVIARRFYHNFCRGLLEFLRMPATSAEEIIATNTLQGKQYIDDALARGHGVVLITAHYGNWETMGARLALAGYSPLNVIARNQRDQEVTELLTSLRRHGGLRVIPRDGAIRESMRRLADNEALGILIDQNAGENGVFVDFFGRLASTAAGAAVLARRTSAPIIPIFCVRQPDGTQVAEIGPEVQVQRTDDVESDVIANTAVFTKIVEAAVRRHPDHWFWMHQRWKARPHWEREGS
jgi:KDO2-lipid IV(A) lauroyltransferase